MPANEQTGKGKDDRRWDRGSRGGFYHRNQEVERNTWRRDMNRGTDNMRNNTYGNSEGRR